MTTKPLTEAKRLAIARKYAKVTEAAYQACTARARLEAKLEALKADKDWLLVCELYGCSPDTDYGDWMA
jgi:hypothetical protein